MPFLQKGPKLAKKHKLATAAPFDTLESVAKKNSVAEGWAAVAQLWFGTTDGNQVNRALAETIGVGKVNLARPEKTEIKPMAGHPGEMPVPETWTDNTFEAGKRYRLSVAYAVPPVALSISRLDKWFIPGVETCDVSYSVAGDITDHRLDFLVYGSNYCECTDWADGWGKFSALDNEPLFKEEKIRVREPGDFELEVTGDKGKLAWRGQVNAAKGVLAKKADAKDDRFVNVAFSPYTLLLRLYKDVADAKARIELQPFWPVFKDDSSPKDASVDIKWKLSDSGGKLKLGQLIIWDKFDAVVFTKGLKDSDLTDGEHTFTWDWKYSTSDKTAKAEEMPYRVQIQGHTPIGVTDGFALATMHTEVRMFVHPKTHKLDLDPYVAKTNKSSLDLGLAPLWHKDDKLKKADDGKIWTKFQLAKAGFHPGPVTDATVTNEFKLALREFQKSVPANTAPPYTRLTVSDNDDDATRNALDGLGAGRKRPWFGRLEGTDIKDYGAETRLLENDVKDPEKDMIVWVDDRYWYADADWVPEDGTTVRNNVKNHATALTDARGTYVAGDNRVAMDARDIARPWLPVEARIVLLSKKDKLSDEKSVAGITEAEWKAMRAAIGPVRVDWTFDEIDGDDVKVDVIDTAMYHKERTRSKKATEWILDKYKASHDRKDVKRAAKYYNALTTYGGIRPTASADYFKAVFGLDAAKCLYPWKPKPDPAREAVATIVHCDLGEKQKDEDKFAKRLGRAGVYFNPSHLAGDGYQLRAEVRFDEHADYKFTNLKILAARYPRLPQAHSARFRLWRKASLRAYLNWGPTDSFSGSVQNFRKIYHASHMHFTYENWDGNVDSAESPDGVKFTPGTLFSDLPRYQNMIRELSNAGLTAPGNVRRDNAQISVTADRLWPWHGHPQLAIVEGTALIPNTGVPATDQNAAMTATRALYDTYAAPYYYRLAVRLSSEIARLLEEQHGFMRGNVIVEMQASSKVMIRVYQCGRCNGLQGFLEKNDVGAQNGGKNCPDGACAAHPTGRLAFLGQANYRDSLPVPSLGNPIGVAINFAGGYELWAHEVGHTRYMEHAGNAPSSRGSVPLLDLVHDSVANPAVAGDAVVMARRWDRACLMTYASHLASYDATKDKTYLCYKCILKNRGWKIENLADAPPANVVDD